MSDHYGKKGLEQLRDNPAVDPRERTYCRRLLKLIATVEDLETRVRCARGLLKPRAIHGGASAPAVVAFAGDAARVRRLLDRRTR